MKTFIQENKKDLVAFILNLIIIVTELTGLLLGVSELDNWYGLFVYYTEDSNIFLLIMSILTSIYLILKMTKKSTFPKLLRLIKYMSICTVVETFLIVVFVLGFTVEGVDGKTGHYLLLFTGSMFYHHFLCPILGLISFVLVENDKEFRFSFKDTLYALIPTLIYAAIVIPLNILKVMVGPYPFLHVYEQSFMMSVLWCFIVLGCAYLINLGVYFLYNWVQKLIYKE